MKFATGTFLIMCLLCACASAQEFREWTNTAGKKISAQLLSLDGDKATLKMANGRQYVLSLSTLSPEDGEFARNWAKEKAALASAPRPKTEPMMTTPGKVLYHSPLNTNDGWSVPHGDWSTSEAGLTGVERAADDHAAVFKKALNFKDVIIEFDVQIGESRSLSLGIDDSSDHVCRVSIYSTGFQARKDDHDHEGPDVSKPFNKTDKELDREEWHTVRLEILGEEMLAQIGKEISLGTDPLLAVEKTKVGFVVSGGQAGFRNMTIWEAKPNEDWEKLGPRLMRKYAVED